MAVREAMAVALVCGAAACSSDASGTNGDPEWMDDVAPEGGDAPQVDETTEPAEAVPEAPQRPSFGRWERYEPEGKVCGNGSQYKFFARFVDNSDDVMVVFEPGGACWDYASCTGAGGIRGAANPDGITNEHMLTAGLQTPLTNGLGGLLGRNPAADFNVIYVPYCTGDVHTGNNTVVYTSEDGSDEVTFHHKGHENVQAVIEWASEWFPQIDRLLLTGCSAGGTGSLANYYFFRTGLQAERGYLINDSGPIFSTSTHSAPMHAKIRQSWDLDSVLLQVPQFAELDDDYGNINWVLAEEFPDDRLSIAYFLRDYNYSLYSYERFHGLDENNAEDKETVHRMWTEDTDLLADLYDSYDNLSYYLPYWREFNSSHCTIVFNWNGTEIQDEGMDMADYIDHVLDDETPLMSYREAPQSGEDGTP